MKARLTLVVAGVVWITGCAAPSATLVNKDGQQQQCASAGFGLLGAPLAVATYAECVKQLESQGFQKVGDVGKSDKKVSSVPAEAAAYKLAMRPVFSGGEYWEYQQSGVRSGSVTATVKGKELVRGSAAYLIWYQDDSVLVLDENLNQLETRMHGSVISENDVPMKIYSWPFKLGDRWNTEGTKTASNGETLKFNMDVTVSDYGKITVPAGTFEAFYIKASGIYGGALAQEIWYSPEVRNAVRTVNYFREGKVVAELESYGINGVAAPRNDSGNEVARLCTDLGFLKGTPEFEGCTTKAARIQ